jgi:hypothetical protein
VESIVESTHRAWPPKELLTVYVGSEESEK